MTEFAFDPWAALEAHRARGCAANPPNSANRPTSETGRLGGLAGLGGQHAPQCERLSGPDVALAGIPARWCEGVERCATMLVPGFVTQERWLRFVADCETILAHHATELLEAGLG